MTRVEIDSTIMKSLASHRALFSAVIFTSASFLIYLFFLFACENASGTRKIICEKDRSRLTLSWPRKFYKDNVSGFTMT